MKIANFKNVEKRFQFNYMMCSRLYEDANAFLNAESDFRFNNPKAIWNNNINDLLKELKKLYNEIPYLWRPQWLSETKIKYLAKKANIQY